MKAINNFWLPRLFSNEYIEGTLAFKGYHGALLSQSIYWSFVAAAIIASVLISLFRRIIKENYAGTKKNNISPKSAVLKTFWHIIISRNSC
ncbi:hypothetical protein [Mycoplasmopsis bovis]|uniref:hypothetical protein n=1 Tax=Mycoplasmopsis bovis TaxID=28903 RepID=UPI003D81746A